MLSVEAGARRVYSPRRVSTRQTIPSSQLTQGRFEVTEILGWDQRGGVM